MHDSGPAAATQSGPTTPAPAGAAWRPITASPKPAAHAPHSLLSPSPTPAPCDQPPDVKVHNMLVEVARSLVAGGKTGVFSPMHMLVFRKKQK